VGEDFQWKKERNKFFINLLSKRLETHDKKKGKTCAKEKKSNNGKSMIYFVPMDQTLKDSGIHVKPRLAINGMGRTGSKTSAVACDMGIDQNNGSKKWEIFQTVLVMTSNSSNQGRFTVRSRLGELMSLLFTTQCLWKAFQYSQ
jgi:hypothetical protein